MTLNLPLDFYHPHRFSKQTKNRANFLTQVAFNDEYADMVGLGEYTPEELLWLARCSRVEYVRTVATRRIMDLDHISNKILFDTWDKEYHLYQGGTFVILDMGAFDGQGPFSDELAHWGIQKLVDRGSASSAQLYALVDAFSAGKPNIEIDWVKKAVDVILVKRKNDKSVTALMIQKCFSIARKLDMAVDLKKLANHCGIKDFHPISIGEFLKVLPGNQIEATAIYAVLDVYFEYYIQTLQHLSKRRELESILHPVKRLLCVSYAKNSAVMLWAKKFLYGLYGDRVDLESPYVTDLELDAICPIE